MTAYQWETLPSAAAAAIEDHAGPVIKAEPVTSGLMPGLTAILHTAHGPYFLKAAPADSPAIALYQREQAANAALPPGAPAPQMVLSAHAGGWLVMLFDYIDSRDADLSPQSADLTPALAALAALSATPAPSTAPPVAVNLAALMDKAASLLARHPAGHPWNTYRAAVNGFDPAALTGTSLTHYDPHPGNLKVTASGAVKIVDWSFACAAAPWLDTALLVPRLIEAGHTPAAAEQLAARHPAWHTAPAATLTALASLWTMFREYKALYGPEDARPYRAQAAAAGRAWVNHRTR